jgi:hypothetical protein
MNKKEIKEIIGLFADKTGCSIQSNGCPCNSCFHALSNEIDFKHIVWILLLALRGDYKTDMPMLLSGIKEELRI